MLIQEKGKAQAAHQKEHELLSAQLQEKAAIIIQVRGKYFKPRFLNVILWLYLSIMLSPFSRFSRLTRPSARSAPGFGPSSVSTQAEV